MWPVPACTDRSGFYYLRQKFSFTKPEELRSRAAQAAKKGRELTFHWRGGYLTRETLRSLLTILEEEAGKQGKAACLSLNWPQAVMRVSFEARAGETRLRMEEANEGELE